MMRMKLTTILVCIALGRSVAFGAGAADIAQRAHNADSSVNYRGIKTACVWLNGVGTSSVVKIVHMKPDMTRKEYFSPRALAGTIVIMGGPDVWRYRPQNQAWEQIHLPVLGPSRSNYNRAFDNYDVQLIGSEKVAGRDAYLIRAVSKREGDVTHRIWVDKGSYLTLRTQTETVGGRVVSLSRFTSIEINPHDISPAAFAVTGKVKGASKPARVDFRVEKPSYLPKGYRLVGLASVSANRHCCAHLHFSNGANTISLFERRTDVASPAPRVPEKLPTIVTWTRDGILFTLIGELSRGELRKIADSTK